MYTWSNNGYSLSFKWHFSQFNRYGSYTWHILNTLHCMDIWASSEEKIWVLPLSPHMSAGCYTWAKYTAWEVLGFPVSSISPPPLAHHKPPDNQGWLALASSSAGRSGSPAYKQRENVTAKEWSLEDGQPAAGALTSSQKLADFSRRSCARECDALAPCGSGSAAGPHHSVWWVELHLPASAGLSPGLEIDPADTATQPSREKLTGAVAIHSHSQPSLRFLATLIIY